MSARLAKRGEAGFTLVEVMIAVALLASLSAMTWAAMASMLQSRDYFERRAERFALVRVATSRMASELASAFVAGPDHGGEELAGEERDLASVSAEEAAALLQRDPIQYGFIGKSDSIAFTSFAHVRTQPGEASSHFAEIGYETRRVRDEVSGRLVYRLVHREDPTPDGKLERGGTIWTLLPFVSSIEFAYWDPGPVRIGSLEEVADGRWVDDWDTTRREHAGRLPTRVKITIELPPQDEDGEPEVFTTQALVGATELVEF